MSNNNLKFTDATLVVEPLGLDKSCVNGLCCIPAFTEKLYGPADDFVFIELSWSTHGLHTIRSGMNCPLSEAN